MDKIRSSFDEKDVTVKDLIEPFSDGKTYHIGLIGLPFDGATRGRPGARFAPIEIRRRLFSYKAYCVDHDVDLSDLKIADFGDLDLGFGHIDLVKERILDSLSSILGKVDFSVILGGDHYVTFPSFLASKRTFKGEWGLVIVDAHHDLRELTEGRISSGIVVNEIVKSGEINPENIVQIGIRGFANSPYYVKKAKELGIKVYTSMDVRRFGGKKIANDILLNLIDDVNYIYFSFDVDGVDIAFAPGVNAPSSGGLFPNEVFEIIYYISQNSKLKVLDVVEFAPPYDVGGMTVDLVANSILYAFSGYVVGGRL